LEDLAGFAFIVENFIDRDGWETFIPPVEDDLEALLEDRLLP
jgi:hypothetical protein